jgi:uncharacterized membrane-anchored protein YhcB (DUF1043 family)
LIKSAELISSIIPDDATMEKEFEALKKKYADAKAKHSEHFDKHIELTQKLNEIC